MTPQGPVGANREGGRKGCKGCKVVRLAEHEQVKLSDLADWLRDHKLRVVSSEWAPGAPAPVAVVENYAEVTAGKNA